jgi:hypothetical protein
MRPGLGRGAGRGPFCPRPLGPWRCLPGLLACFIGVCLSPVMLSRQMPDAVLLQKSGGLATQLVGVAHVYSMLLATYKSCRPSDGHPSNTALRIASLPRAAEPWSQKPPWLGWKEAPLLPCTQRWRGSIPDHAPALLACAARVCCRSAVRAGVWPRRPAPTHRLQSWTLKSEPSAAASVTVGRLWMLALP